jgi:predicted DNA-binding transcriptional regulator AlpA
MVHLSPTAFGHPLISVVTFHLTNAILGSIVSGQILIRGAAMYEIPSTGFLRLAQILGDPRTGVPALLPISKSSWWAGVKTGRYPAGVLLGPRTRAWSVESIRTLIAAAEQKATKRGTTKRGAIKCN